MFYDLKVSSRLRMFGVNPSMFPAGRLTDWAVRMRQYDLTPEEAAAGFIAYLKRTDTLLSNHSDLTAHVESIVVRWVLERKLDLDRLKRVMVSIESLEASGKP